MISRASKIKLDKCRKIYEEALKRYESDEEIRLAAIHEPKVSLNNIHMYSSYLQGARDMMLMLSENYKSKNESQVYTKAVFKLVTSSLKHTALFMFGACEIGYRNHIKDKRGKLESVEAYFCEPIVVHRKVEILDE